MKTLPVNITEHARDTALNNRGLDAISKLGRDRDPAALREVARQFEAMFLQQMLKSMRSASDVFAQDNFMNSSDTQFYRDMYDQQLTLEMSAGKGMGIAESFYRQMLDAYGEAVDPPEPAQPEKAPITEKPQTSSSAVSSSLLDQASTPEAFTAAIQPYVNWAASVLKISPKAIMAQAALETGWGKHVLRDERGNNSYNLFNIKTGSQWAGDRLEVSTTEYRGGEARREQADFRQYESLFSAFRDYVQLLQKPRYQQALAAGDDAAAFARELQRAGYATDPEYADKIIAITEADVVKRGSVNGGMQVAQATLSGDQG